MIYYIPFSAIQKVLNLISDYYSTNRYEKLVKLFCVTNIWPLKGPVRRPVLKSRGLLRFMTQWATAHLQEKAFSYCYWCILSSVINALFRNYIGPLSAMVGASKKVMWDSGKKQNLPLTLDFYAESMFHTDNITLLVLKSGCRGKGREE